MSESYFQTKRREELAEVRKQLAEIQRNVVEADPKYVQHEKLHPGRIANFMDRAADHLDEAERMIPAMAPLGPQRKALWVSFLKALELADHCVRQALYDRIVQRDRARQEGTRKRRNTEINEWIERQLRRQPDAKCPELWRRIPEDIILDNFEREKLGYDAFTKRVTKVRGTLGLKRKNSCK